MNNIENTKAAIRAHVPNATRVEVEAYDNDDFMAFIDIGGDYPTISWNTLDEARCAVGASKVTLLNVVMLSKSLYAVVDFNFKK